MLLKLAYAVVQGHVRRLVGGRQKTSTSVGAVLNERIDEESRKKAPEEELTSLNADRHIEDGEAEEEIDHPSTPSPADNSPEHVTPTRSPLIKQIHF